MTDRPDTYRQSAPPFPDYRGNIEDWAREIKQHCEMFERDYFENHRRVVGVWDDLRFPAEELGRPASNSAQLNDAYFSGQVLDFTSGNKDQTVQFNAQMPHGWQEETDVDLHLHATGSADVTGTVQWVGTYTWASIDASIETETEFSATSDISVGNDWHMLMDLADLTAPDKYFSSMIIMSVTRQATSDSDTYAGDVHLMEVDIHYINDTIGSREEKSK